MSLNFGDSVLYTENGKTYKATVLGSRILDHHSGKDGEPLVQLAFFVHVPGVLGTARQGELVQWRVDVAHESHEYTGEHRAEAAHRGQHYPGIYGGGRWKEVDDGEEPSLQLTPEARKFLTQAQLSGALPDGSRPAYPGSAEGLATVTSTTGLTEQLPRTTRPVMQGIRAKASGDLSAEDLPEGIKPKVEDGMFAPRTVGPVESAIADALNKLHDETVSRFNESVVKAAQVIGDGSDEQASEVAGAVTDEKGTVN